MAVAPTRRKGVEGGGMADNGALDGTPDGRVGDSPVRVGILGVSGYAGGELVRLLAGHGQAEIAFLTAEHNAGKALADVHPHLAGLDMPVLSPTADVDMSGIDVAFTALPHGRAQTVVSDVFAKNGAVRVIDLSADFRLADVAGYAVWYGHGHRAPALQQDAVYGLTEVHRPAIAAARLVANPGCTPTTAILALAPLLAAGAIAGDGVVVDAKTGVTAAGRMADLAAAHGAVSEGVQAYGVGGHRHAPEIEQELSRAAGRPVTVSFTPHLLPMNRGTLVTCYVRLAEGRDAGDLLPCLEAAYGDAPFVQVLGGDAPAPATHHVRGSNTCRIAVFADRAEGRAIVVAATDNLVKGTAGQAVQNMNVMFGLDETLGLDAIALTP